MTKDEFMASLLLLGNIAENNAPIQQSQNVWQAWIFIRSPAAYKLAGWVTFRPRGFCSLDCIYYRGAQSYRIVCTIKRKQALQRIVQLIEENNHDQR